MAEFFGHMRTLRRLVRRWGLASLYGSSARLREFSSWIQPIVRIDREWDDDDRQMWGYTADHGTTTGYPAVAIFAQSKEVLIRRLDAIVFEALNGRWVANSEVNILTPPGAYNPVVGGPPGEFYPFLQTTKATAAGGAPLSIPECRVVGGENPALMAVTIGGVLVAPAIGPRRRMDANLYGIGLGGIGFSHPKSVTLVDWHDPPIILPPWRVLAVQFHNHNQVDLQFLQVEIYLSERVTA